MSPPSTTTAVAPPPSFLTIHQSMTHEDEERLLLTTPAMAAYIQAEVHVWLMEQQSSNSQKPYQQLEREQAAIAISEAIHDSYQTASDIGILSHHGALISYLNTELREYHPVCRSLLTKYFPHVTTYQVAKQAVDVLHHRLYRGTYTKTVQVTGAGDKAAREAVLGHIESNDDNDEEEMEEEQCLVEPPPELTSSECLWTDKDDAAWRERRFEKITMEGWRDPRRGNSGTSR